MNLFWEFVGGKPVMFNWMLAGANGFWFNAAVVLTIVYIVVSLVLPKKAKK